MPGALCWNTQSDRRTAVILLQRDRHQRHIHRAYKEVGLSSKRFRKWEVEKKILQNCEEVRDEYDANTI